MCVCVSSTNTINVYVNTLNYKNRSPHSLLPSPSSSSLSHGVLITFEVELLSNLLTSKAVFNSETIPEKQKLVPRMESRKHHNVEGHRKLKVSLRSMTVPLCKEMNFTSRTISLFGTTSPHPIKTAQSSVSN